MYRAILLWPSYDVYILDDREPIILLIAPVAQRYPCNLPTRWDVSSIPASRNFLTKKLLVKDKNKNAQRVEND